MTDSVDSDSLLSTVLKGGTILFLGLVFELGLSFIAKLLIARYLGPVEYGVVSLGITTMSLAAAIVAGGLHTGIGRYLPRYDGLAERRGVLASSFQLGLSLALVLGFIIVVFAPWIARNAFHDSAVGPVLRIFGVIIPLAAFVKLSLGAVRGMQHSLPKVYIDNITLPFVRFVGIAVVIALGLGVVNVAWAYLASYASAALVSVYYLARRTSLFSWDVEYTPKHREILVFSAPLAISAAMSFVFAQFDTLLLGYFSATEDVGIYNVIYPVAQLLTVGVSSVVFVFMPVISELHSEGVPSDMRRLYRTATKWIFTATLPLFLIFVLFPTMSIKITFGAEYVSGASALSVLAVAFFSHAMLGPNGNTLTSIGRTRLIMYDTGFAALLNLGLNLLFIPRYSFFGAAVATAISYALLNIVYSYQLYRETGIHPFTRAFVIPGLIGVVTVGVIYLVTTMLFTITVPLLIVMFGIFLGLYGFAVLRFGIEEEEIMLLLRFEDHYDVDLGPFKAIARRLMGL